jgi:hypothetical protein
MWREGDVTVTSIYLYFSTYILILTPLLLAHTCRTHALPPRDSGTEVIPQQRHRRWGFNDHSDVLGLAQSSTDLPDSLYTNRLRTLINDSLRRLRYWTLLLHTYDSLWHVPLDTQPRSLVYIVVRFACIPSVVFNIAPRLWPTSTD